MFENLKKQMRDLKTTQKALAQVLGISEKSVGLKLAGKREFTRTEMVQAAKLLHRTLDELFGE